MDNAGPAPLPRTELRHPREPEAQLQESSEAAVVRRADRYTSAMQRVIEEESRLAAEALEAEARWEATQRLPGPSTSTVEGHEASQRPEADEDELPQ